MLVKCSHKYRTTEINPHVKCEHSCDKKLDINYVGHGVFSRRRIFIRQNYFVSLPGKSNVTTNIFSAEIMEITVFIDHYTFCSGWYNIIVKGSLNSVAVEMVGI